MTPPRLKLATAAILVTGVLAAGSQLTPNGPAPAGADGGPGPASGAR